MSIKNKCTASFEIKIKINKSVTQNSILYVIIFMYMFNFTDITFTAKE